MKLNYFALVISLIALMFALYAQNAQSATYLYAGHGLTWLP